MVKLNYKNKKAFSLVEMLAVLMIVSIIIIILSINGVNSFERYKERLAINELVSDIYYIQTASLKKSPSAYIDLFSNDEEYSICYDGKTTWKKISNHGKTALNGATVRLKYREGNLITKANTIDVRFEKSSYRIIVHIDNGYVTVDEI